MHWVVGTECQVPRSGSRKWREELLLCHTYQGAGKMTVRRSEMAMDMRTRLVGDRMCFLLSTIMIRMLDRKVTAWKRQKMDRRDEKDDERLMLFLFLLRYILIDILLAREDDKVSLVVSPFF